MIEFRTLGAVDLRAPDGTTFRDVLVRPKEVALLAFLAAAGERDFVRRDVLRAMLWPESDDRRARASLRSALYHIRQVLGDAVLVARGDEELALDRGAIHCDATAFERAIEAEDREEALALYRGPFLEGFFAGHVPEFERWVERRRRRMELAALDAALALVEQHESGGRALEANRWAARLATFVPDDSDALHEAAARRLAARSATTLAAPPGLGAPGAPGALGELDVPRMLRERHSTGAPRSVQRPVALAVAIGLLVMAGAAALLRFDRMPPAPSPQARADSMAWALALQGAPLPGRAGGVSLPPELAAAATFAEGEAAFRMGRYAAAVEAFARAVEADSTFALAHYRLSVAAAWNNRDDLAKRAAEDAIRHAARLDSTGRTLVYGWSYDLEGRPDSAWTLYHEVLRRAPTQGEAWLGIGEIAYHYGSILGLPPDTARAAFERAARFTPEIVPAQMHLLRIAARGGDRAAAESLHARLHAIPLDPSRAAEADLLWAMARGDRRAALAVPIDAGGSGNDAMLGLLQLAATHGGSPALVRSITGRILRRGVGNQVRVRALLQLLQADHLAGDARAWRADLAVLRAITPSRALEVEGAARLVPGEVMRAGDAGALARRVLARGLSRDPVGPDDGEAVRDGMFPPRRALLGALLLAAGGDTAGARAIADSLARWPDPNIYDAGYARQFARIVRADLAMRRGDPAGALAALGHPEPEPGRTRPGIVAWPRAHERWLRARAYVALGRAREARAWTAGFPDPNGYDLAYLPAVNALLAR